MTLFTSERDPGPFFHGTKAPLSVGEHLLPKQPSNFEANRISNYIYFTATLDAAKWGAELAVGPGDEHIYVVEPVGDYHDDPNVTNTRFKGNPTRSYRSDQPLKIVAELKSWERHSQEQIDAMEQAMQALKETGDYIIID